MTYEAGPELDCLIAERVMGYYRVIDTTYDYDRVQHKSEILLPPQHSLDSMRDMLPRRGKIPFGYFVSERYSSDIAAAWAVVERFCDVAIEKAGLNYEVTINAYARAQAPTASLAICRAALAALEEPTL